MAFSLHSAAASQRVALLLGQSDYKDAELAGVRPSLDAMAKTLTDRGFLVQREENLKGEAQKEALSAFARSIPSNGTALVYLAGYGVNLTRGSRVYNLLLPVGENLRNEGDCRRYGLDAAQLLEDLGKLSGAGTILLLLDTAAPGTLPEKTEAGLRAFAPEHDAAVYAATGAIHQNGVSPLAAAFAKHAARFDQSIEGTFTAIHDSQKNAGSSFFAGPKNGLPAMDGSAPIAGLREGKDPGETFINAAGMVFRWCPAGTFTMGSERPDSSGNEDRKPVEVTLSKGFWMGAYEVTQREYNVVLRKNPPVPTFTLHRNAPIFGFTESKNVTDFCKKLNEYEKKAGRLPDGWAYACPSEAQWEYACRAGSKAAYSFGDSVEELGQHGNFADRSLHTSNPNFHWAHSGVDDQVGEAVAIVGSYQPNQWGLYDMHGNVAELVADHLSPALPGGTDPLHKLEKNGKPTIRGGAWCSLPEYCEASFRNTPPSRNKSNFIGFRVLLQKK